MYRFNPLSREFDFSARIPQPYLADPTADLESLRITVANMLNLLVNAQIMKGGPGAEIFADGETEIFADGDTEVFADEE